MFGLQYLLGLSYFPSRENKLCFFLSFVLDHPIHNVRNDRKNLIDPSTQNMFLWLPDQSPCEKHIKFQYPRFNYRYLMIPTHLCDPARAQTLSFFTPLFDTQRLSHVFCSSIIFCEQNVYQVLTCDV